jgi:hypothetical protein
MLMFTLKTVLLTRSVDVINMHFFSLNKNEYLSLMYDNVFSSSSSSLSIRFDKCAIEESIQKFFFDEGHLFFFFRLIRLLLLIDEEEKC